jgi:transposase
MEAYSMDLRQRAVALCEEGVHTRQEIAELLQVSTAWLRRLLQRRRETGSLAPKPHGGGRSRCLSAADETALRQAVAAQPDATLAELRDRLDAGCCLQTLHNALARLGLTRKKSHRGRPSRTGPMSRRGGRPGGKRPRP